MESGKVLRIFKAKDGREVIIRTAKWEDLDNLLNYINTLLDEELDIIPEREKWTREEEADWLGKMLVEMEKGKVILLVAEINGKVIALSDLKTKKDIQSHIGELGISVRYGYRDRGIGTEILKTQIEESRKVGLKVLLMDVFDNNNRAKHVYEKVGFKETGRIPMGIYRKNSYVDDVLMTIML